MNRIMTHVPQTFRIRALSDVDEAGMNQLVGTSRRDDKSRVQRVKRKRAPRESRLIALKYSARCRYEGRLRDPCIYVQ